jgi:hypothetical protein
MSSINFHADVTSLTVQLSSINFHTDVTPHTKQAPLNGET